MADPIILTFMDQLLAKINALPQCQPPVQVFDGSPTTMEADTVVAIGGTITPLSDGKQRFAQLGFLAMWEEFYVDGVISAYAAGDSGLGGTVATTQNAQRQARINAVTILNAIFEALRADPAFATANGGTNLLQGGYCRLEDVQIRQTENERGRFCEAAFRIYVKNRIATQ